MDIACQGGLIADIFDMGFLVQYRLIEISTALMRVEPNSMPRTVFPLSVASWVSFRFMFISQDLKSFLQTYFSGKRLCSFHSISIRTLLIGNCFFRVRVGGTSGAGVGGVEVESKRLTIPTCSSAGFFAGLRR
jgi:hypothetical protein